MSEISFLFIGPSKTASTWIYEFLRSHPGVSLPPFKESFFFDRFYHKGFNWYQRQFSGCDKNLMIGEFSHDYILEEHYLEDKPDTIARIHRHMPNVKLICCLRNPYQRTLSGYYFLKRNGYQFRNLIEACTKHSELVEGSLYFKNISNVLKYFSSSSLLILDFEKLKEDPFSFADDIQRFLELEHDAENPLIGKKVNPRKAARFRYLSLLLKKCALLFRKLGLHSLLNVLKRNQILSSVIYKKDNEEYKLSKQEFEYLENELTDDISKLQKLLGKKFEHWKNSIKVIKDK